jgi:hypothetical protein
MAGFNPTLTKVGDGGREVYGATEVGTWQATFLSTDTYTTGGWGSSAGVPFVANTFGLSRPIAGVTVNGYNTAAVVWIWQWNFQTSKLMMLGAGGGAAGTVTFADATSSQSLSGFVIQLFIWTIR